MLEEIPKPHSDDENLELLNTATRDVRSYLCSLEVDPNEAASHKRAPALLQQLEAAESTGAKVDVLLDVDAFLSLRQLPSRDERPISQRAQADQELDLRRVLTQAIEVWIDPDREIEQMSEAVQQSLRKYFQDTDN